MNILQKIDDFYLNFKGEKGIIGKSLLNKPLYYMAVKKSDYPKIIVTCSIHAREYITSYLCLKLISYFNDIGTKGTVYFIPAVNPDGIEISLTKKPLYKANARGVDLNVNFDARWGQGALNTLKRGDENYIGTSPFSEPETKALRDFTYLIKPNLTISYHSKGQEIYYKFHQSSADEKRDYEFAKIVQETTLYQIKDTPFSCGGYKDWCIEKLKIPALTIEVGLDSLFHPIKEDNLEVIFLENKMVLTNLIARF